MKASTAADDVEQLQLRAADCPQQQPRRRLSRRRDPRFDNFRRVSRLSLQAHQAKRQLGVQASQGISQQHVGREHIGHQTHHQIAGIIDLVSHDNPRRQRMRSHRIGMNGLGPHRVDDVVLRTRGFFGGRGGNGCQLTIDRTQRRAFSLSAMPGKCRRSSTIADNSPLSTYALRIASAVGASTTNIYEHARANRVLINHD
jgi:hypothetical protein